LQQQYNSNLLTRNLSSAIDRNGMGRGALWGPVEDSEAAAMTATTTDGSGNGK